jgi:1,4-alpha-glucan branching enzyme
VWALDGYPSRPAYRDTHRLTPRAHQVWANDGAPYDADRGLEQADTDAREFLASLNDDAVVAFDTELLGHHWHEGVAWLRACVEHAEAAGVELAPPPAEAEEPAPELPASSWGKGRDLRTWSLGELAWLQRRAELTAPATERALRELLALQSSDWAFLIDSGTAGDYPRERFDGHLRAFGQESAPELRNLAPYLGRWAFVQP